MFFPIALAMAGANVAMAATVSYASRPPMSTINPSPAAATESAVAPLDSTSNVRGKGFDRIIQIWLENTVRLPLPFSNACSQWHRTMLSLRETLA